MNLGVLMDAAEGDTAFAHELAGLYLSGIDDQLRLLRLALIERSADRIGHIAHYAKGSSAACGATALAALFDELSQLAQRGEIEQCSRVAADIGLEFGRVQQALRALPPNPGMPA